LTAKLKIKSI